MQDAAHLRLVRDEAVPAVPGRGPLALLRWLWQRAEHDRVEVGQEALAATFTVSIRTIHEWTRQLEDTGCLWMRRSGTGPAVYVLLRDVEGAGTVLRPARADSKGRYVQPRDGDRDQARRRVNYLVEAGQLACPNVLPCMDCGHEWAPGERRHEFDHSRGYGGAHHEDVEPVCSQCHAAREKARRIASGRPRRTSTRAEIASSRSFQSLPVDPGIRARESASSSSSPPSSRLEASSPSPLPIAAGFSLSGFLTKLLGEVPSQALRDRFEALDETQRTDAVKLMRDPGIRIPVKYFPHVLDTIEGKALAAALPSIEAGLVPVVPTEATDLQPEELAAIADQLTDAWLMHGAGR